MTEISDERIIVFRIRMQIYTRLIYDRTSDCMGLVTHYIHRRDTSNIDI